MSKAWIDGICSEAEARKDEIAATQKVNTLYFGGGTPSVLPPAVIGRIADACGGRSYDEWTVELNPDDVTPEYARELHALGVNRVSMGVQSLDDGILSWMARRHDAAGARAAFRRLRDAGFDNISVDVIFGVGGMDADCLERTVRELLEWRPEHISAYQLSVEEGSALERLVRDGRYTELPDEACEAQYRLLCRLLSAAGYEHYEISNWALPDRRAKHNSAYWTRAPYVGLGPGAHSLRHSTNAPSAITPDTPGVGLCPPEPCEAVDVRSWNSEELENWTPSLEVLTEEEILEERIMLGLRTADGVEAELVGDSDLLVPSAVPGRMRIPEDRWFTADDIISSVVACATLK